jgi:ADP-heptose:LPS heptosyltransferase
MAPTKKILVIRLSSLGDLVLSTAAIGPLRAAGYGVYYVTKKDFAPLLEGHPEIAGVFAFDKNQGEAAAREALFQWIEQEGFSLALDLQDSWRSWSWRRRMRGLFPVFVAHKPRLQEWLVLYLRLGRWFGFGRGGRALRFRHSAQAAVGASAADPGPGEPLTSLYVSDTELAEAKKLLPEGDFVAVLPASAWKGKEWPRFPQLAASLARFLPVVALGATKDAICDEVAAAAAAVNPASRSLRGKTSLRLSMAVLAQARWAVGNDTGMVHVAEALGRKAAMIEGPTHPALGFSLFRPESAVIGLPLICRPCSKSGRLCPRFGSRRCLNDLSPAQVEAELQKRGFPC